MAAHAKQTLLAISQRVLAAGPGGYRSDLLDQAWFPFLDACGIRALALPNSLSDPETLVKDLGLAGLILSGGNNLSHTVFPQLPELDDTAPDRDRSELALVRAMQAAGLPVVGVCRGMQ